MDSATRAKVDKLRGQHKSGLVVGLNDVCGNKPKPRLDIDDLLYNHPKTFNLLILALEALKGLPSNDIMSYYQLASIHGWPQTLWNKVAGKGDPNDPESGYCAHGTTKFPTWHRPYLAMLEQALFLSMIDIADQYADTKTKNDYLAAALEFRLPYWDYYRPRDGPVNFPGVIDNGKTTSFNYDYRAPIIFTEAEVYARKPPNNSLEKMTSNPFSGFAFNSKTGTLSDTDWNSLDPSKNNLNRQQTNRNPWDPDKATDPSFVWTSTDRMNKKLNELRMDANRYLLDLVSQSYYKSYDVFASQGVPGGSGRSALKDPDHAKATRQAFNFSGSLESIHGLYHVLSGGAGHMGRVALAAYDPIFWFHHCQIERIFTIWQKVHETESATNWFDGDSTLAGETLLPFQRDLEKTDPKEKYWTSDSAREASTFGYYFEDVKPSATDTKTNFDFLYRWSVPVTRSTLAPGKPPASMEPLPVKDTEFFKPQPVAPVNQVFSRAPAQNVELKPLTLEVVQDEDVYEWFVDDQVERMALNGAFEIMYFINYESGRSFDDSQDVALAPTLAGISYIFAAPREGCDNCGSQYEQARVVRDTSPITSQLLDYVDIGQLESMRPEHVKPFLIDRLRWRIYTVNGEKVDPRRMSAEHSLQIGVSLKRTPPGTLDPELSRYDDIIDTIIQNASGAPSVPADL